MASMSRVLGRGTVMAAAAFMPPLLPSASTRTGNSPNRDLELSPKAEQQLLPIGRRYQLNGDGTPLHFADGQGQGGQVGEVDRQGQPVEPGRLRVESRRQVGEHWHRKHV